MRRYWWRRVRYWRRTEEETKDGQSMWRMKKGGELRINEENVKMDLRRG